MRRISVSLIVLIGMILGLAYGQVDQLNPAFYPYITAVRTRVMQVVNSLPLAKDQPGGIVKLRLCITREGTLKDIWVSESSGQKTLDDLATSSIEKVFPFIPFPAQIEEPELWIDMPLVISKEKRSFLPLALPSGAPSAPALTPLAAPTAAPSPTSPVEPASFAKTQVVSASKLEEYIRIGLVNHQPTRVAREQVDLARLKINEAQRAFYPVVTGEYKTTEGKTITDPYESISYGLQAEQLLLGINQVRATLRREQIGLEMARKNYDKLKNDVRYEVAKSYYELVSQAMILKHWQEALEDIKPEIELLERLYEAGLAIAADFENAQSQHKLILYQVVSAESNVSLAKLALLQAMNLDPSQLEQLEVPAKFDFAAGDLGVEFSKCVDVALRSRPEIELWQTAGKSAKINELIAKRENQPKFSMVTSYGRSGEAYARETLDMVDEWSLMGRLSWLWGPSSMEFSRTEDRVAAKQVTDTTFKTRASTSDFKFSLLDRLNYYTAKKEAKITYQQAVNELNEAKKKILYEVREAYFAYKKALAGIKTSLNRVEFRQNEFKVVKARAEVGEGSSIELLESKMNLANEKAAYLRSLGEYYLAIAALDKASGYQLPKKI